MAARTLHLLVLQIRTVTESMANRVEADHKDHLLALLSTRVTQHCAARSPLIAACRRRC